MVYEGAIIKLKRNVVGMLTKDNVAMEEESFAHARIFNFFPFPKDLTLICLKLNYFTEFEACSITVLYDSKLYDIILDYEKDMEVIK